MKKVFQGIRHRTLKLSVMLAAMLVLLFSTVTASADIIYEPEDDFYKKHSSECETDINGWIYTVNCKDGSTNVYASPVNDKIVATLNNGTVFWANTLYEDANGVTWVFVENVTETTGWISINVLAVSYDSDMFMSDYNDRISAPEGDELENRKYHDGIIYFYDYPDSLSVKTSRSFVKDDLDAYSPSWIFVDDNGRTWGYVGYYCGHINSWYCLDDPYSEADELYKNGRTEYDTRVESIGNEVVPSKAGLSEGMKKVIIGVSAGVSVLVIVTVILLAALKKKGAKKKNSAKKKTK